MRKAREGKLIPEGEAEKLRRIAGAYVCVRCQQEHRTESELGKKHLRLQPSPPPRPLAPKDALKKGTPLPVQLTQGAKAAGKSARARLTPVDDATAAPPPAPDMMPKRGAEGGARGGAKDGAKEPAKAAATERAKKGAKERAKNGEERPKKGRAT